MEKHWLSIILFVFQVLSIAQSEWIPQVVSKYFRGNRRPMPPDRLFPIPVKIQCWQKSKPVPGRHPDRWRYDAVGNIVSNALRGCHGCLCHEYDHIVPYSKGGQTVLDNCQVLQSRTNYYKGNQKDDFVKMATYGCAKNYSEAELDMIEMAIYGSILRPGLECRAYSKYELGDNPSDGPNPPRREMHLPNCPLIEYCVDKEDL